MATIRKRTNKDGVTSYHVQIRLKGYSPETESFKRLTDAKIWAASTEAAMRENRHFKTSEAKKHTLDDAVERFRVNVLPVRFTTHEQELRAHMLDWWSKQLGYCLLSDLTPSYFAEARDTLIKQPSRMGGTLSPDTIRRYFLTIKAVLKACIVDWAWLEESPLKDGRVELPSLPKGRVRFLDDDERARLLDACKQSKQPWLYLAVVMAVSTGMRRGELMHLYWKAPKTAPQETAWGVVNLSEQVIILHATKNGERRRIPLAAHVIGLLKQHAKIRRLDTSLLFPSLKNPDKPLQFESSWKTALKRANIEDFKWHDLRHCTASYLAMNGASLAEIAEVLGHKTLEMVKRYAHLSDGHVSSVVESMNTKIFGGV